MSGNLNRRSFLKKTAAASTGATLALSFEEKALLAAITKKPQRGSIKGLPMGRIGNVKISRMFAGGNLISGSAHSRDLDYVSSLLRRYFADGESALSYYKQVGERIRPTMID